jgi:hypothetical protein
MADTDGVFVSLGRIRTRRRRDRTTTLSRTSTRPGRSVPTTQRWSPRIRRARCTSTRTRWRPGMEPGAVQLPVPSSASSSPPALIGTAVVGAAVGGISGHLWRGMSRS